MIFLFLLAEQIEEEHTCRCSNGADVPEHIVAGLRNGFVRNIGQRDCIFGNTNERNFFVFDFSGSFRFFLGFFFGLFLGFFRRLGFLGFFFGLFGFFFRRFGFLGRLRIIDPFGMPYMFGCDNLIFYAQTEVDAHLNIYCTGTFCKTYQSLGRGFGTIFCGSYFGSIEIYTLLKILNTLMSDEKIFCPEKIGLCCGVFCIQKDPGHLKG